ncbi:IS3 family transposase [Nocardia sp. NPDC059246]|uniref:IS3 family transposase n=1 Tax=unclassified Nocardia TaxID=2637762 RepID=UPI00341A9DC2
MRFVDEYRERFSVTDICHVLEFRQQTYFAAKKREREPSERAVRDAEILAEIHRLRAADRGRRRDYGARKMWRELLRAGVQVGRGRVERLMRAHGLAGLVPIRRKPRTTVPGNEDRRPKDLVDRDFRAPAPNQLWVADITYVELAERGFCYVAFVTDVFSRAIVGWQVSDSLKTELALDALEMALWNRRDRLSKALIHHGDRGVQYTALRYGERLAEAGIAQSVGSTGDSYDNALSESVNSLFKKELIGKYVWSDVSEVNRETAEWVSWYNNERLHSWCGYRPPAEFERVFWEGRGQQLTAA